MSSISTEEKLLPGEDGPLEMRYGGAPLSPDEVLGVSRRMARAAKGRGRKLTHLDVPDELPAPDATLVPAAYRLPPRTLLYARAKAEMEGTTLSQVIVDALEAYAASSPGAKVSYKAPKVR